MHLDERNNLLIECFTVARLDLKISWVMQQIATEYTKPVEPCTSFISRIIWVRTNMSMAKMCTSRRGKCINRVFHCSTPGSQDIVADATNRYQVWVSRWNIAPQLSQEPFELEQICQWLKCAPRWEKQSINRVFHCSTPGSQDKLANATDRHRVY